MTENKYYLQFEVGDEVCVIYDDGKYGLEREYGILTYIPACPGECWEVQFEYHTGKEVRKVLAAINPGCRSFVKITKMTKARNYDRPQDEN